MTRTALLAQDAVVGECFGDGVEAMPGEVVAVDVGDHGCGQRVGFEPVQALAAAALLGLGCGPASTRR